MKICIVTVHRSLNSGSFLQAFAIGTILKKSDNNVAFLASSVMDNLKYSVVTALKKVLKLRVSAGIMVWKNFFRFCLAQKSITEIKTGKCEDVDCFVIGSDTVWNFEDAGFNKYKRKFLCSDFDGTRRITYAVSIGNTPYEVLYNDETITKGIMKIDSISVRDNYTKEAIKKITGKEPTLVLDPTLLLSREEFAKLEAKCSDSEYILIYMFERLSKETEEKITELRQKTGKKIVSFGGHRAFADINISNDPFKFLYYFNHADMVITNTFHGTIFSIINRKPFADFGGHKKKVTELLDMLDLSSQLCETPDDIEKILNQKIDYDKVEEKLSVMREQSKDYLFSALKG